MTDQCQHPSDETLLRAIDGELSPRRDTTLEGHLATCEACRARLQQMESAAAEICRLYRDEHAQQAPCLDASRARLLAEMTELSAALDRSWRDRVAERLAALPRPALVAAALAIVVVVAPLLRPQPEPAQSAAVFASVEAAALPIRSFTPGATRDVSLDELCRERTPTRQPIPAAVRTAVLRDYQMEHVAPEEYELDYLITPELGGTADRENLWPERYGSRVWNARVKDDLERLLPQLVCQGTLDLTAAQQDIAADWIAAYKKYFRTDRPLAAQTSRLSDDDDLVVEEPEQHVALRSRS